MAVAHTRVNTRTKTHTHTPYCIQVQAYLKAQTGTRDAEVLQGLLTAWTRVSLISEHFYSVNVLLFSTFFQRRRGTGRQENGSATIVCGAQGEHGDPKPVTREEFICEFLVFTHACMVCDA